jgi:hypothetical protein
MLPRVPGFSTKHNPPGLVNAQSTPVVSGEFSLGNGRFYVPVQKSSKAHLTDHPH